MSALSTNIQERDEHLSSEKTELLQLLYEQGLQLPGRIRRYPRRDRGETVEVVASWAQERMWFIDQLEEGRVGYQVPVAIRLQGELDAEVLQKALNILIQRHEVLRTVFVSVDGEPRQEIMAYGSLHLKWIDLSSRIERERESQLRLEKIEESRERFDLRRGPLIRGRLIRLQAQEHLLIVTMHHIVADGWSKAVLVTEVAALYRILREQSSEVLQPLQIQYADYAQWQREQWHRREDLNKQLSYWRARLHGAPAQLDLPTDRPRSAVQSYRGQNVRFALNADLSSRLRSFAQRRQMTLFMALYAGLAILLSRLSGQEDIIVGTPVANRQRPELEGLIGIFVNTLLLRLEVCGNMQVEEFLQQVKDNVLGAYDHQSVPFEKVIEVLHVDRSLKRNPLFQVMFILHNQPRGEQQWPGLIAKLEDVADEPAILDLWLSMQERGEEIFGSVNYAADLFDRETVDEWVECYQVLLREVVSEQHRCIADLQIVSERERGIPPKSVNIIQPHLRGNSELLWRLPSDAKLCILDNQQRAVPTGTVAEIYVAEAGVPPGHPGMVRTGELGRWRRDGTIECLGPRDQHVMNRGSWVNLSDIESQLLKHPQVNQALVIARDDFAGGNRLVAYVTRFDQSSLSAHELRAHLKGSLPKCMIPSEFMLLEDFPKTSDGKPDRGVLPIVARTDACADQRYGPPRGEVEEVLAMIWQDVLHTKGVGPGDDFFELGGYSLLTTRVVSRIRELLQVELPLRTLFEASTLKELADRIQLVRQASEMKRIDRKTE